MSKLTNSKEIGNGHLEKASFADIRKEISLIKQELEQRKEVSLLDEKIKAVQKKIDRFSTQDFSEKQKELLKTELHNVEEILQTYTKKYLGTLKETITSVGNVGEGRTSSLKNRPPEVAQHIIESAGEITEIADGDDKNIIARIMQSRMKELLT